MKKEIREIITEDGGKIVRISIADERWYITQSEENEDVNWPSVTWIGSFFPKGKAFWRWLADKGWSEAEAIKSAAGDKGSKVHQAVEDLTYAQEVKMDAKYLNPTTNELEELTLEEYECLMSFTAWFQKVKPIILNNEMTVFSKEHHYAGTLDLICKIPDKDDNYTVYIIDLKTGQTIWPEHKLQISAYSNADFSDTILEAMHITKEEWDNRKLATLQIGYKKNKAGFKLSIIDDCFELFLATLKIWQSETEGVHPKKKDYPVSLDIGEFIEKLSEKERAKQEEVN